MISNLLILFCFLLCLTGLGALVIKCVDLIFANEDETDPMFSHNCCLYGCASLCIGQGIYSIMIWALGYIGLFVITTWLGMALGGSYLCYLVTSWLRVRIENLEMAQTFPMLINKLARNKWSIVAWTSVLSISLWLGNQYAIISLAHPIEGVPGMGNWAYKTKIIYLNQGIPSNYFSDYATHYGKFSYPAGFPILNSAYFTLIGGIDESLVKLHSVILLSLSYLILAGSFLQRWKVWGLMAAVGILPLFLNESCLQIMRSFYSEPLLLFCAVVTLILIDLNDISSKQNTYAIFCAGCAAWVKQEGILFFALLSFIILILCLKKRTESVPLKKVFMPTLKMISLVACVFILPWKTYTLSKSVNDSDFDFNNPNFVDTSFSALINKNSNTQAAVTNVYDIAFKHGHHYAGLFWIAPCLLLLAFFTKNRMLLLLPSVAFSMIALYIFVMAWSEHQIGWHLGATQRYLMLPALCVAASLTSMNNHKPQN